MDKYFIQDKPKTAVTFKVGQERPKTALAFLATAKRLSSYGPSKSESNFKRQREKDLSNQRDLLNRMVRDRDDQISSLENTMEVQKDHIVQLDVKLEISNRREKQSETRHEMRIENMTNEQKLLKSQLKVLQDEVQRIKSDPVRHARTKQLEVGDNDEKHGVSNDNDEEEQQTKLLQGQLFQAMTSLSQLRNQASVMKGHYDAVVKSLQKDLKSISDKSAEEEAQLLNKIYAMDNETKVEEEALRVELKSKDEMIERLEERLSILENSDSSTVHHENESIFVGGVNHGENLSEDENETSLCCDHTDVAISGNSVMEGMPEFSLEELHAHHGLKTFSSNIDHEDLTLTTGQTTKSSMSNKDATSLVSILISSMEEEAQREWQQTLQ